jgi:hypothetical protein
LTTLTESTLKSFGFFGMTASEASATRVARNCSDPGCLAARAEDTAVASCSTVGRGDEAKVEVTRAVNVSISEHWISSRIILTLQLFSALGQSHLVPLNHVARVQAHRQEVLGSLQQLSSEDQDEVGCVAHLSASACCHSSRVSLAADTGEWSGWTERMGQTHLRLLRCARHDEKLGRRVSDLDLPDDSRCIRGDEELPKVVDDELVAT